MYSSAAAATTASIFISLFITPTISFRLVIRNFATNSFSFMVVLVYAFQSIKMAFSSEHYAELTDVS